MDLRLRGIDQYAFIVEGISLYSISPVYNEAFTAPIRNSPPYSSSRRVETFVNLGEYKGLSKHIPREAYLVIQKLMSG
jgi:hypothetical protein